MHSCSSTGVSALAPAGDMPQPARPAARPVRAVRAAAARMPGRRVCHAAPTLATLALLAASSAAIEPQSRQTSIFTRLFGSRPTLSSDTADLLAAKDAEIDRLRSQLQLLRMQSQPKSKAGTVAAATSKARTGNSGLVFLHIPKAGTSFVNTLFAFGCRYNDSRALLHLFNEWRQGNDQESKRWCHPTAFARLKGGHYPLQSAEARNGRAVGMFRRPSKRLASGFAHDFHDCPQPMQHALNLNCTDTSRTASACAELVGDLPTAVRHYSRCVGGCMTRMLTGSSCGRNSTLTATMPRAATTELAVQRVRHAFAFAGDTEQWNRSVCVFCALFAPRLQPYDYDALFVNVRPSRAAAIEGAVEALLEKEGYVDAADAAVYAEATAWLDRVEPQVRATERYRQCHAAWRRRRR